MRMSGKSHGKWEKLGKKIVSRKITVAIFCPCQDVVAFRFDGIIHVLDGTQFSAVQYFVCFATDALRLDYSVD